MKAPMRPTADIEFSPDGKWLAAGGVEGVQLLPSDGTAPIIVSDYRANRLRVPERPHFSQDGKFVIWVSGEDRALVKVWSLSKKKIVRTFHLEGWTFCEIKNGKAILLTEPGRREWKPKWGPGRILVRIWKFDRNEPEVIADLDMPGMEDLDVDTHTQWITYPKGSEVFVRSLDPKRKDKEQFVGKHAAEVMMVVFRPDTNEIASLDANGELRLWSLVGGVQNPVRVIPASGKAETWRMFWFDPKGKFLILARDTAILRFDLTAPADAEPLVLSYMNEESSWVAFDEDHRWMAISWDTTLAFYPLTHPYPHVFRGSGNGSFNVRFTPDGKSLLNGFDADGIRIWNMSMENDLSPRTLWKPVEGNILPIDVDPLGRYVLAGTNAANSAEGVHLISMADGKFKSLKRGLPGRIYDSVAFSPDGKFAAAVAVHGSPELHGIEIWDLQSGSCHVIEQSKGKASFCIKYAPDGSLFSGDSRGNLYQWDLKEKSNKVWRIGKGIVSGIAITNDGRYVATSSLSAEQWSEVALSTSELVLYDLKQNRAFPITSHGNRIFRVAFDAAGTRLVTGDLDGNVRVGPITGEAPHLLIGHDSHVGDVAVRPAGRWIASTGFKKAEVRLWPMPEGTPFHTLPYNEFLNRLRALTNVRAIQDKNSSTGYRIEYGPFPGWNDAPAW